MVKKAYAAIIVGFCLVVVARAEETTPDSGGGRYTFSKVTEGLARLDSETGEVSICSQRTVGWACQAVPEDRAVLENEIARLRHENVALKKVILSHGLPLPAGAAAEVPPAAHDDNRAPGVGVETDVDRVIAFVGRVWHRLVEAIAQAQKQVLNKS